VAVLAIFGAQQYKVFEPSSSMSFAVQSETQGPLQARVDEAEPKGPQFQLPSGFEVPQATARTVSTGSYNSSKSFSNPIRAEIHQSAKQLEMDRQIQAYMQGLMSQQAAHNYQQSNSIFVPTQHVPQHTIEP
jgi:hypothetical protein